MVVRYRRGVVAKKGFARFGYLVKLNALDDVRGLAVEFEAEMEIAAAAVSWLDVGDTATASSPTVLSSGAIERDGRSTGDGGEVHDSGVDTSHKTGMEKQAREGTKAVRANERSDPETSRTH